MQLRCSRAGGDAGASAGSRPHTVVQMHGQSSPQCAGRTCAETCARQGSSAPRQVSGPGIAKGAIPQELQLVIPLPPFLPRRWRRRRRRRCRPCTLLQRSEREQRQDDSNGGCQPVVYRLALRFGAACCL